MKTNDIAPFLSLNSISPYCGHLGEQLIVLTPSEAKKQRRLIRNRMSAQLHRQRKAEAEFALQTTLKDLERKVDASHENERILIEAIRTIITTPGKTPSHVLTTEFPGLLDSIMSSGNNGSNGNGNEVPTAEQWNGNEVSSAINISSCSSSDTESSFEESSGSTSPAHYSAICVDKQDGGSSSNTGGNKKRKTTAGTALTMGVMAMLGVVAVVTNNNINVGNGSSNPSHAVVLVDNNDKMVATAAAATHRRLMNAEPVVNLASLNSGDAVDATVAAQPLWRIAGGSYQIFDLSSQVSERSDNTKTRNASGWYQKCDAQLFVLKLTISLNFTRFDRSHVEEQQRRKRFCYPQTSGSTDYHHPVGVSTELAFCTGCQGELQSGPVES